jgi:hypothetical protein
LLQISHFAAEFMASGEPALITRERHRRVLEDGLASLDRATNPALAGQEDLLAEELRAVLRALNERQHTPEQIAVSFESADLQLRVDPRRKAIQGNAALTFRAQSPVDRIVPCGTGRLGG